VNFISALLNILFPQSEAVTRLEHMTADEFLRSAKKSIEPALPNIITLFHYKDPLVREALWELKYRGNPRVAKLFAHMLHDEIISYCEEYFSLEHIKPIIVPIPLAPERLRERGWNQIELITRELEKIDRNRSYEIKNTLLYKRFSTIPQTKLSRKKRLENLKGCFAIKNPDCVSGKVVILLDDVVTTGSTLSEAMRVLQAAGARVVGVTVAH
jgi:competence protein ComFC